MCRLAKEQNLYAQENQDQKMKVDKLVAAKADEWDIKNGVCSYHPRTLPRSSRPKCRTCGPPFCVDMKC